MVVPSCRAGWGPAGMCWAGGVRLLSHPPASAHVRQLPDAPCGGRASPVHFPGAFGQLVVLLTWGRASCCLHHCCWRLGRARWLFLRVSHPCSCPGSRPDVRGPHAAELACSVPSRGAGLTQLVLTLWGGGVLSVSLLGTGCAPLLPRVNNGWVADSLLRALLIAD